MVAIITFIPPHLVTAIIALNQNGRKVKWSTIEEYIDNRTGDPKTRVKKIEI